MRRIPVLERTAEVSAFVRRLPRQRLPRFEPISPGPERVGVVLAREGRDAEETGVPVRPGWHARGQHVPARLGVAGCIGPDGHGALRVPHHHRYRPSELACCPGDMARKSSSGREPTGYTRIRPTFSDTWTRWVSAPSRDGLGICSRTEDQHPSWRTDRRGRKLDARRGARWVRTAHRSLRLSRGSRPRRRTGSRRFSAASPRRPRDSRS
jgi:hypothetical protein